MTPTEQTGETSQPEQVQPLSEAEKKTIENLLGQLGVNLDTETKTELFKFMQDPKNQAALGEIAKALSDLRNGTTERLDNLNTALRQGGLADYSKVKAAFLSIFEDEEKKPDLKALKKLIEALSR